MAEEKDIYRQILEEIGKALVPLKDVVGDVQSNPGGAVHFLRSLGWDIPVEDNLSTVQGSSWEIVSVAASIGEKLQNGEYEALLGLVIDFIDKAATLSSQLSLVPGQGVNAQDFLNEFKEQFPTQLVDYVIISYLEREHPRIFHSLRLTGLFETGYEPPFSAYRCGFMKRVVCWDKIAPVFSDPKNAGKTLVNWGTADFDGDRMIGIFGDFARAFDIPVREMRFSDWKEYSAGKLLKSNGHFIDIPLIENDECSAGIRLSALPATAPGQNDAGLSLSPYATGGTQIDLGEGISLELQASLSVDKTAGLQLRPTEVSVFDFNADNLPEGSFLARLKFGREEKTLLLGSPGATRLELKDITVCLQGEMGQQQEISIEFSMDGLSIVIQGGDGDGFLQKILPSNPITLDFDMTLGMSSQRGFYFKGGAGIEYTFQINKSIGPITVTTVDIKLAVNEKGIIVLVAAVSANGALGPVAATVSKIGLQVQVEPGKKGNLGNADLSLGFKPPSGVGLAIDASVVKGGGFLEIEDGNYAGILNLDIQEKIAITAIGILTTRLPDGSKIFSLKIIGMVEFPPIQLGFGFFLSGIGLAVAIECTMNAEALRASVYTGSLTSLLFPPDPIKNAAKIIADIKSFFPPKNGCFVFGAMVKAGWGGATSLVKLAVGIFIEIEGTSLARIALAGNVLVELPTHDDALVHIEMQFIGIIDFGNSTLSIDAAIVKSFITKFNLAGGMALRTCWGEKPRFAMAAGGFYPGYRAPDGFPALSRISISLGDDNPRIGLFLYMAIAENSVQFGAALLLYFSKDIAIIGFFEVEGALGFDAIIRFNPFSFEADLYARLTVKRNHQTFCGIDLELYLSGPNDYHAVGHAKVEICGISAKVEFDKHFGDKTNELPAPVVSPLQMLLQEVNNDKNWTVSAPTWGTELVTLRDGEDAKAFVDTSGGLVFHQQSVPLKFTIAKLGEAAIPPGEDYFDIVPLNVQDVSDVEDSFAPGQFEHLSDQEKVSAPPFEKMKSGVAFSSQRVAVAAESSDPEAKVIGYGKAIGYRTINNDKIANRKLSKVLPKPRQLEPDVLDPNALSDWKALAGRRYHLNDAARNASKGAKIAVKEQNFTVVTPEAAADGRFQRAGGASDMTYAHARRAKKASKNGKIEIMGTAKVS